MQQEPGQGAAVGVVPPCGLAAALQPPAPSGLAALLNHGSSKATSALYDLLAGGTDTPRSGASSTVPACVVASALYLAVTEMVSQGMGWCLSPCKMS